MILKKGDKNTNVAIWQAFLKTQVAQGIVADGHFGDKTELATKDFQAMCAIASDGIVGDGTIQQAKNRGFAGFPTTAPEPVKGVGHLVLVSAGHTNVAGMDQGAAGNGFIEGKEAVEIRDRVAAILRERGVSVLEDGADGVSEPLTKAIVLARKADIAVEFHFNAGPPAATGIEVLSKPNKRPLALRLAAAINRATGISLRGGDGGWKSDQSGQHHRLGFCEAGGLIVEMCFISNASDMAVYEANFEAIVRGIAEVLATA